MALSREDKGTMISDLSGQLGRANAAFLIDFKGMTVDEVTKLRIKLHGQQAEMKVVRNTLAIRALQDYPAKAKAMEGKLVGTNAFVFAYGDVSASAKTLLAYADEVEELDVKAGIMGNDALDKAKVKYLATLPSIDVLRAQFLGLMATPATKFVGTLAAVPGGFARLLNGYKQKQEQN